MIYNSHFSNLFNHLKWFMQKCLPINLRASCCRIIFSIFCFWEATGAVVMYPVSLVSVSVPATFLDGMKKPNWIHCVIAQIVLGFATTAIKSVSAAILTRLFGFVIIFCGFTTFFFLKKKPLWHFRFHRHDQSKFLAEYSMVVYEFLESSASFPHTKIILGVGRLWFAKHAPVFLWQK